MARKELLPPGFRFHPTDVELIMYYLKRKILGKKLHAEAIAEVNIYKFSPWDLPDMSCLKCKDLEWFFFCPIEKKYTSGARVKRATEKGFWKATGKDRPVHNGDLTVGMVKTLVFHLGHAPQGERTDWVIHEYRICDEQLATSGLQDTYVLCKVFKKNGPGPKNGAQYGAPFNEADWSDDEVDAVENPEVPSLTALLPEKQTLTALLPEKQVCVMSGLTDSSNTFGASFVEDGSIQKKKSVVTNSIELGSTSGLYSSPAPMSSQLPEHESDDDIMGLLASLTDDTLLLVNGNGNHEDHPNGNGENQSLIPFLGGCDIYSELHDLNNFAPVDLERLDFPGMQTDDEASLYNMLNSMDYIELDDLAPAPSNCFPAIESDLLFDTFGSPSYNNMSQFYFGGHHSALDTNQLVALADQPYKEDSGLDVLHEGNQVNNQFYLAPNAVYDSMTRTQPSNWENGGYQFDQSMNNGRR